MDLFFNPKSVAIIGVSPRPGNLAARIVTNLESHQFIGKYFLIGPRGGKIGDAPIYKSLDEINLALDLAVILTPAATVPGIVRQCGEKGISRVIIESGGFSELGEKGRQLSKQINEIAKHFDMRIIGPNCIGVTNRKTGLALSFPKMPQPPAGGVSMITQSGGLGISWCNDYVTQNVPLSKFASIGNKIDVNENELLEYFGADPETNAVVCYLESLSDGRKFFESASKSAKPIILMKGNVGETSREIAAGHTSAMATDERVVDAMTDQAGIIRVRHNWEMISASKVFALPPLKGKNIAIVSRSGGHAVLAADHCHYHGLSLPALPENLRKRIERRMRAGVIRIQNPLDLGDVFDVDFYESIISDLVKDKTIDGVVFLFSYFTGYDPKTPIRIISLIQKLCETYQKPVAFVLMSFTNEVISLKTQTTFPIFDSPDEAIWALAQSRRAHKAKGAAKTARRPKGLGRQPLKKRLEELIGQGQTVLNAEAFPLLETCGVRCVSYRLAKNPTEVALACKAVGFPVVLKVEGETLTHKTDMGGVRVNVKTAAEAMRIAKGWVCEFGNRLNGILVQAMAPDGPELMVGARRDPQFGPLVLFGWGGVLAELMEKPVIRLAPFGMGTAREMIDALWGQKLLDGFRGAPGVSRNALADVLTRMSHLIADHPFMSEIEVNPFRAADGGLLALDVRGFLRAEKKLSGD